MENDKKFLQRAIEMASESILNGGGPFGAVIVKDNEIHFRSIEQGSSE